MSWNLNSERPIYAQLMERITLDIISGIYPPGSKLPSVRDLAQDAGVNPNTMQKALSELERTGLLFSQRTSGRFVTEELTMIEKIKTELASEQVREFLEKMRNIGFDKETTLQLIQQADEEEKETKGRITHETHFGMSKFNEALWHKNRFRQPESFPGARKNHWSSGS